MGGERHRQISYAYFTAFISLLNNIELVRRIFLAATRRDTSKEITKGAASLTVEYSELIEDYLTAWCFRFLGIQNPCYLAQWVPRQTTTLRVTGDLRWKWKLACKYKKMCQCLCLRTSYSSSLKTFLFLKTFSSVPLPRYVAVCVDVSIHVTCIEFWQYVHVKNV